MKKDTHPIDDFFRESLQDFEAAPSGKARSRFLDIGQGKGIKGNSGQYRWYYIASAIVLICTTAILYVMTMYHPDSSKTESSENIIQDTQIAGTVRPPSTTNNSSPTLKSENKTIITNITDNAGLKAPIHKENRSVELGNTQTNAQISSSPANGNNPVAEPMITQALEEKAHESIDNTVLPSEVQEIIPAEKKLPAGSGEPALSASLAKESNIDEVDKPSDGVQPAKNSPADSWSFIPFLKYNFEWVFEKKEEQKINTLGIEGLFQHGKFKVKTGIGLSITDASDNVQVQYNNYLGTYQKLDSLTFSWDERHYYLLPSYYMSDKKVWDSAVSLDYYQVTKRYSLIQIPVMFGYTVLQRERFSMEFNAGANVTFYMNSKKLSGDYSTGQSRVINMNPMAADLMRTNWYFVSDLGFSYRLLEGIFIELEPQIKYLINPSQSQKSNGNNILMPDVRASLKIKL